MQCACNSEHIYNHPFAGYCEGSGLIQRHATHSVTLDRALDTALQDVRAAILPVVRRHDPRMYGGAPAGEHARLYDAAWELAEAADKLWSVATLYLPEQDC